MKTKLVAIAATLAMIIGFGASNNLLAQAGKDLGSVKREKKGSEGRVDMGIGGIEQTMVKAGPPISPEEAAPKLIKGKTTLDEVLLLLGSPGQLHMYGEGGRMAMYHWRTELRMNKPNIGKAMAQAAMGPFALIGSGKRVEAAQQAMDQIRNSIKTLTATFGSDGVLKDFVFNPPIMPMPAKPAPPSAPVTPPQEKAENAKTPDAPFAAVTPPPR